MINIKNDKSIIFTDNVTHIFKEYVQTDATKHEAGGILLGQINEDYILITKSTIPNKKDKASRFGFIRDKSIAQYIIDYEFKNSGGRTIYLGEWHTHPEDNPYPSSQDIKMIQSQYKNNIMEIDFLLLVIAGLKSIYVGVYPEIFRIQKVVFGKME